MRKILLATVASVALIALTPAMALAKHNSRHHHAHHARHARIHHRRFGDPAAATNTSPTTTPTTTPTTSPAATVSSFTGGVLTITLANGSTVSGMVGPDTRLACVAPPSQPTGDDDQGDNGGSQGDDNGGGDDRGDSNGGMRAHDEGQGGDDQGQGDDEQNQMCTTANLVAGTPVQFADLSIDSTGTATWDVVVLVTAPSTPPLVPDTDNDGS